MIFSFGADGVCQAVVKNSSPEWVPETGEADRIDYAYHAS